MCWMWCANGWTIIFRILKTIPNCCNGSRGFSRRLARWRRPWGSGQSPLSTSWSVNRRYVCRNLSSDCRLLLFFFEKKNSFEGTKRGIHPGNGIPSSWPGNWVASCGSVQAERIWSHDGKSARNFFSSLNLIWFLLWFWKLRTDL